jgi:hypothetical protein
MHEQTISYSIQLPSIDDFLAKYPRYTKLVDTEGTFLFDLIMQPEVFLQASVLADFNSPSVLAVAELCRQAVEENSGPLTLDSFTKQFIGAAICTLMEANGYQKSGTKKSVPHPSFSIGEFYI